MRSLGTSRVGTRRTASRVNCDYLGWVRVCADPEPRRGSRELREPRLGHGLRDARLTTPSFSCNVEHGMSARLIPVTVTVYATVVVDDPEPFERVTGPDGDEWRSRFYDLYTDADVAEHLAFNAIANRIHDVSELEGWADVQPGLVRVEIDDTDVQADAS